jgi:hypothetical protein
LGVQMVKITSGYICNPRIRTQPCAGHVSSFVSGV